MWQGTTVSIHLAESAGAAMRPVEGVRAVAGRGLEADRYYAATGYDADQPGPLRAVSLIGGKRWTRCGETTIWSSNRG